jgi:enoyl-[acyl-carrier protein] reductase I
MGLMDGKRGVVFGIANEYSIAYRITQNLAEQGAEMAFTHLPDKDPARPKNENKVRKLVDGMKTKFLMSCDVTIDEQIDAVFNRTREEFGAIDFVVHSIAFAPPADLTGPVYACSREGFKLAMEISAYSLIAITGRAKPVMNKGGSILCLTYLGGEKVIPGYNLMGLCKSALESATEYLASELGPSGIRVNALSAGPVKTVSSQGVGEFDQMLKLYESFSPMRRNVVPDEVGKSGMFLLSDLSTGITGETLHVDCGYHIMGAPPHDAVKH